MTAWVQADKGLLEDVDCDWRNCERWPPIDVHILLVEVVIIDIVDVDGIDVIDDIVDDGLLDDIYVVVDDLLPQYLVSGWLTVRICI